MTATAQKKYYKKKYAAYLETDAKLIAADMQHTLEITEDGSRIYKIYYLKLE